MLPIRTLSLLAASLMLTIGVLTVPASAQSGRDSRRDNYDARGNVGSTVTAESRWGNGHVSGPVRQGQHGPEVRLPGGTWVHCVRSCSETLRRESIDFWQSHGNHAPDQGPGYFERFFRF
jgi:hypothetical protein